MERARRRSAVHGIMAGCLRRKTIDISSAGSLPGRPVALGECAETPSEEQNTSGEVAPKKEGSEGIFG